jgi:hypothetical protein
MNTYTKTIIAVVVVFILIAGSHWLYKQRDNGQIACTQDALICPDGSAVGRTGPNCEFAPCPSGADVNPGWQIFTDLTTGLTFQYPEKLSTTYIGATDWPPKVNIEDKQFTCKEAGDETARAGKTERRIVGEREYCVTKVTEGAAGSIYTLYAYAFPKDNKTMIFTFSLQSAQCGNFDEEKKTECEGERETFDIDSVIDKIAQSIK